MISVILLLAATSALGPAVATRRSGGGGEGSCPRVDTIKRSLRDNYCDQPLFVNFLPKSEESQLLDNVCYTMFPLPDDPDTFELYHSKVYCDGSTEVISFISTDFNHGMHRTANPFQTSSVSYFGYAGCDTYLSVICTLFGDTGYTYALQGVSTSCKPIGLSCLRKVEEIISDNCLPDQEFYALPMKLPNRCVTQQQCIANSGNQFYKALGLASPVLRY